MNRTRPPARAQSLAQHLSRTLILAVVAVWLVSTGLVAWFVDRQIQTTLTWNWWKAHTASSTPRCWI